MFRDVPVCSGMFYVPGFIDAPSDTGNSKEPKSLTYFNYLTFFHADINQSEVEDSFQLSSDWIKSARKNVNKSKAVTLLAACRKIRPASE